LILCSTLFSESFDVVGLFSFILLSGFTW
jgi:hypothetical protein